MNIVLDCAFGPYRKVGMEAHDHPHRRFIRIQFADIFENSKYVCIDVIVPGSLSGRSQCMLDETLVDYGGHEYQHYE